MADLRAALIVDCDSGGGSELVNGVNLRLTASGGSIEAIGQQVMASSIPVVLASNQTSIPVDTEMGPAAALTDNFANPTAGVVGAFNMLWDSATWDRAPGNSVGGAFIQGNVAHDVAVTASPLLMGGYAKAAAPTDVSTDADAVNAWFLRNGAQATVLTAAGALIGGDATNGLDVDVTRVTGTVTVDTELLAVAALADAVANPTPTSLGAYLIGFNGTTWDRVRTANTGRLQVDVITGGGGPPAPTLPLNDYVTSASLAAGSEVNLDTTDSPAKKLAQVTTWASVAYRARVFIVSNGVEASEALAVGGGPPFTAWTWTPAHPDYTTLGTSAGLDAFRVEMTNLDDGNAADVHAAFLYQS